MNFDWDPIKARKNIRKHNVTFEEAATVLWDKLSITIEDTEHSNNEERFITIGLSSTNTLLVVVHTFNNKTIRIISARKATRKERKQYEEE